METLLLTNAITAETAYIETGGRKLAYRIMGEGSPIILCNRFRGVMDDWDPLFLDQLAAAFRVIIFDYSGVGLSTGLLAVEIAGVADDVKDLADGLDIETFTIIGWSYGGMVAQTFSVHYPASVTQTILIGTKPAGENAYTTEKLFIETASHAHNDFEDQLILFFEPSSASSRKAAKESLERIAERITDRDIPVGEEVWARYFQGGADFSADDYGCREKLGQLKTPVLALSGDHDIVFPVENWYALTREMPNLYIVVLPQAGHGPQHQYPELSAAYIINFIRHSQD